MATSSKFNVFVGSETGFLKGLNSKTNSWQNINQLTGANKENEIKTICIDCSDSNKLIYGTRSHKVYSYDIGEGSVAEIFQLENQEGNLKSIKTFENSFLLASDNGSVKVWDQDCHKLKEEFSTGENLCCMVQSSDSPNIIATGGKETDLKIWDVNDAKKCIFQAKNVRNDWLNLRVPICVLGAEFIPKSDKIVTCTGHHQVRVYDPKVQRRPVLDMVFDEYPITALSLCPLNENYAVVGNSQGKMGTVDFRKGKLVNIFKGFAGSIRDIKCPKTQPLIISCGLDRYVRIHDFHTKELNQKFYMKSRLNCLLLNENFDYDSLEDTCSINTQESNSVSNIDENDDELWNKMEIVETKAKRKREIVQDAISGQIKKTGQIKKIKKNKEIK